MISRQGSDGDGTALQDWFPDIVTLVETGLRDRRQAKISEVEAPSATRLMQGKSGGSFLAIQSQATPFLRRRGRAGATPFSRVSYILAP